MEISFELMEEVSKIQKQLFMDFNKVCKELKLNYMLIHGSLLGAVLYNDCFPGDDDIDVAMLREDYEKFCLEGPKLIKEGFFLQTSDTDKEFPLAMAKLRDSNTTYIQENMRYLNINHGIYIDIFPIDNYIENSFLRKVAYFKLKLINLSVCRHLLMKPKPVFVYRFAQCVAKILYPSIEKAITTRKMIMRTGRSKRFYSIYGSKIVDLKIPIEYLQTVSEISFAGINAYVPRMYKEYLSLIYGDYINYSPVKEHILPNGLISTNAWKIDTKKAYSNIDLE